MKNDIKKIFALVVGLCLTVNCGGGGSISDLSDTLSGETFVVDGLDDVSDEISAACSTATPSNTMGFDVEVAFDVVATSGAPSANDVEVTIAFGSVDYDIEVGGDRIYSGSWEAVDGNTLALEIDGDTVLLDVDVDTDNGILTVGLNDSEAVDCGSSGGGTVNTSSLDPTSDASVSGESVSVGNETTDVGETENEYETLVNTLFGTTWCFESGYPHFLAVVFDTFENATSGAYPHAWSASPEDNVDFLSGANDDLVFVDNTFYAYTTKAPKIRTYNYGRKEEIDSYASIAFTDESQQTITIDYGVNAEAIFALSTSSTEGSCPDLSVSAIDLARL